MNVGTAHLTREIPAERAVAAIVPRQEIIDALQDPEARPELVLQVATVGGDARSTIGIEWSRDDLEQLLRGIDTGDVMLTLDSDELQWAFDDVEAHGLRERAVVFAVAAVGALGSGATIANAMPTSETGSAGAATAVAQLQTSSSGTLSNVHTPGLQLGDAGSAGVASSVKVSSSDSIVSDAASAMGDGTVSNVHTPGLQLGDAGSAGVASSVKVSSSDSIVSDAASGGGYVAPVSSSHETFGVQWPAGSTDGLLAGGALLVIAGATFASRRLGGARPA